MESNSGSFGIYVPDPLRMSLLLQQLQKGNLLSQEKYGGNFIFLHNKESHIFLIRAIKEKSPGVGELFHFTVSAYLPRN